MILDKVNSPADLKLLPFEELPELASDIRKTVLNKVSQVGGHVGPNLGVVEMTIALHRVFESPHDKFVWDVSHQSYPHKILTGRKYGFTEGHFHDITPYTSQAESEHDFFTVGHTSTSIANAMGLAKARDLRGEDGNVVAIIGDGSISGGLAMEALNNAGDYEGNLIIIFNDNQMSIAENHGGIYKNLAELRETHGFAENNFFKGFGLDYYYVEEGNRVDILIETLEKFKNIDHPIVLHVKTEKGMGYQPAMEKKESFHWHAAFDLETGENKRTGGEDPYTRATLDFMKEKVAANEPLIAINAAIPALFNLKEFAAAYPERYYDAGIAEQFTITFGGAIAAGGARPIIFHNSTFLQRAYDQVWHDLAVNNEPAVVIVRGDSISASDTTHQGDFAKGWISNIPNLIFLAPTTVAEFKSMLEWATTQREHPVFINLPAHTATEHAVSLSSYDKAHYQVLEKGAKVALLGLGGMLEQTEKISAALKEQGIQPSLLNALFISELDKDTLNQLASSHEVIVTLEDGVLDGGFGQKVAGFLGKYDVKVLTLGAEKEFNEEVPVSELYNRYHLSADIAAKDIVGLLSSKQAV
ncbi:MAG: 1-deoxy-D-xylulose-5-phosphate synthase [Streptococcaceae bacterium]|jgi:1-deoxy-D-xylulose-5-phosphate synthase|nr:1-deoxy-D-xylulose-5-phosphate synthase [Streptococcaceae bacterium]